MYNTFQLHEQTTKLITKYSLIQKINSHRFIKFTSLLLVV